MRPIARINSMTTGGGKIGPRLVVTGSTNVLVEGMPCARVGDTVAMPFGKILTGKNDVLINGRPCAMLGSSVSFKKTDIILNGCKRVFI